MSATNIPTPIELFEKPVFGTVDVAIAPGQKGRVQAMASIWNARFYDVTGIANPATLMPGESVLVVGRQCTVLLVVRMGQALPQRVPQPRPLMPTMNRFAWGALFLVAMGISVSLPERLTHLPYQTWAIARLWVITQTEVVQGTQQPGGNS
jgi:hypothetical protein